MSESLCNELTRPSAITNCVILIFKFVLKSDRRMHKLPCECSGPSATTKFHSLIARPTGSEEKIAFVFVNKLLNTHDNDFSIKIETTHQYKITGIKPRDRKCHDNKSKGKQTDKLGRKKVTHDPIDKNTEAICYDTRSTDHKNG